MDEQRTAQEIRMYCEAIERDLGAEGKSVHAGANYVRLGINARVDMIRILDAGVKLRRLFFGIHTWKEKERILEETKWLEADDEANNTTGTEV